MTTLDPSHIPGVAKSHGGQRGRPSHAQTAGAATTTLPGGVKIPDLRFEQGYLKAISVHVPQLQGTVGKTKWDGVAWITLRDQLLSPLLQGIVLGAASSLLYPLFPVWKKALFGTNEKALFSEDKRPPLPGPLPTPWWRRVVASIMPSSATHA